MSEHIFCQQDAQGQARRKLVRQHPEQGFRILQRLGAPFEWLANVALQEHEREDGSGYPKGLRKISFNGQLIGIIDEVVFFPDRLMIVDDKPGDIAWPGSKMQLGKCGRFTASGKNWVSRHSP